MNPRLLDLFCGAGGCSVGYNRAGWDVTGVDIESHPDYPYELVVADAMEVLTDQRFLSEFDAVHASPPCPRYSRSTPDEYRHAHPDLLQPTIDALKAWGGLWIVENVPGSPMPNPTMICGRAMGLKWTRRHRLFTASVPLMSPGCACSNAQVYGVTGDSWEPRDYTSRNGRKARSVAHAREVMGIDWMTRWADLADAIPPVYTEFVGGQLIEWIKS